MDKNTVEIPEYFFEHVFWTLVSLFYYYNFLYRDLNGCTSKFSRGVYGAIITVCVLNGFLLTIKRYRNSCSVYLNIASGFGIYTMLAYSPDHMGLIRIVLIATIGIAITFFLHFLYLGIKKDRRLRRYIPRRIISVLREILGIGCTGLLVFMVLMIISKIFDISFTQPVFASAGEAETYTNSGDMDTMALLQPDIWAELSEEERLHVLQAFANNQQRDLHIPYNLVVEVEDLPENTYGCYSDADHRIIISRHALMTESSQKCVETIAHEAYHSMQHCMIEVFDNARDELKELEMFSTAKIYKQEMGKNYINGSGDYFGYLSQQCETDARIFAEDSANELFQKIEERERRFAAAVGMDIVQEENRFSEDADCLESGIGRYIGTNDLIGFEDRNGNPITQPIFLEASEMKCGAALVRENENEIYFIDASGARLTQDFADGYGFEARNEVARVKTEDDKWALIDTKGNIIFEGADEIEGSFTSDGVGSAVIHGQAVLLRIQKDPVLSCEIVFQFEEFTEISPVYWGKICEVRDEKENIGIVSAIDGSILIPAEYASFDYELAIGDDDDDMVFIKAHKFDGSFDFFKFTI